MKWMLSYLKGRLLLLLALAASGLIFPVVMALYGGPREGLVYALVLWLAVTVPLLLWDLFRFRRRIRELTALLSLPWEALPPLPPAAEKVEEGYQALVRQLWEQKQALAQQAQARQRQAEDYYAAWVHEIKTPLAAMDLLLQSPNPSRELLRQELWAVEKDVELVLTYQRLFGEGTDLVMGEQDLDAIVRGAVRSYARHFIARKLTMDFTPTGRTVLTDEKWLSFVLCQLLSNALKYTPSGGVRIYGEGETLVVEDTGLGIDPGDLQRVFERSFTGRNGREHSRSSGLGLYLCRRICRMLGHGIAIDSERGRGTRVLLTLTNGTRPRE